ncbi:rhodanese-like domain-containing protein [Nonlabens xiamenensis]|uniref:rhodanese-like domain-containing protein n=1 Tax=Nonlabens xiamenensis TaxID=2341043 RepID=UPI000F610E38|nr:rhodanese-like domain-containing protein [Nonlabens xiamenensis]
MQNLNNQEWKEKIAEDTNAVIIDVRTEEEVAEGTMENALHHDILNPPAFMDAINALDKSKNYYLFCRAGSRSTQACQIMEQMGFDQTYNLTGGFSDWDGPVTQNS